MFTTYQITIVIILEILAGIIYAICMSDFGLPSIKPFKEEKQE